MSIKQLVSTGTKVWSDSVEPKVIETALARGITCDNGESAAEPSRT